MSSTVRFDPTPDQERAVELFLTGDNLAISAGAGAGKTATLVLLAEAARKQGRRGQYTAFNKSIVTDAGAKMPDNVNSSTFHSHAFGAMREKYAHRLGSHRVVGSRLAKHLHLEGIEVVVGGTKKWLAAGFLAGVAMKGVANFCQSGDDEPTVMHVPRVEGIDLPKPDGSKGWAANREVAKHVLPAMRRAWADLLSPHGALGFRHEHYLKIWSLDRPRINADFIMVDEFQDSSGVMLAILDQQQHAQLVGVGDASQAINGWMGAVDALSKMDATHRTTLSRSWRFGPDIADVANGLLERLDADLRLEGGGGPSTVDYIARPRCILTRTNAQGVKIVLGLLDRNIPVHLMGGGTEVVQFAQAAQQLMAGERAYKHPELAPFATWAEVQEYCLAPGARILRRDLSWTPVEALAPGDDLLAFDEESTPGGSGRKLRPSSVEGVSRLVRPCRRLLFDDGSEVTASIEHRWLVRSGGTNRWKRTRSLKIGDPVLSIGRPWDHDTGYDSGWLAGLFDGEGCVNGTSARSRTRAVSVSQQEGLVLDRLRSLLLAHGFQFGDYKKAQTKQLHDVYVQGGLGEQLRLLGTFRPTRLLPQAEKLWNGRRVGGCNLARVVAVEAVGEQEVVAVKTSTRTFIAEGLLSHNCEADLQGGDLKLLVSLIDEHGPDVIIDALGGQTREGDALCTISTAHKSKGREWESVRIAGDFRPPKGGGELSRDELMLAYVAVTRARAQLDVQAVPHFLEAPSTDDNAPF